MAKSYRVVSQIIERQGRKPFFNKIGVAFDNKDGSINLQLFLFPGVTLHIGIPKVVNGDEPPAEDKSDKPEPDITF